jgi:MoaA/NifB/PqqE/SkfB family radical SAM enzyme
MPFSPSTNSRAADLSRLQLSTTTVRLDASTMCQLKCPLCPTGMGENRDDAIGWGYLKFDDFKRFINAHPRLRNVEISNAGEIFLNPELCDIIRYSHQKKVTLSAISGTNFNNASDEVLEHLVKYEVLHLTCSIDGASPQTYSIYRREGDFETVIGNVRKLNALKSKYNSTYPLLTWQFVIMGHNEHELPVARDMARELGMEFMPKLNWDLSYAPVRDRAFVRQESGLGVADRREFRRRHERDYLVLCHQLWLTPQINWDGKLLGCCRNRWRDFGNVFEIGLDEALRDEDYVYMKQMLAGLKPPRYDIPCIRCDYYKNMTRPLAMD